MSTISLQEFEQDLMSLLSRVEAGESFLVTRGGAPVVELRPVTGRAQAPRPFGLAENEFRVPNDFDEPLSEAILQEFEGT